MLNFANINFLASKQAEYNRQARRLLIIQVGAFSVLIVYVLVIVGIFSYSFYLKRQGEQLETQIKRTSSQIQELASIEAKHLFIKSKIESLVPVFESKQKHQELTEAIFALLPTGMSIQGFTISETGDISFSAEASSFQALRQFLANVKERNITPTVYVQFAEIGSVSLQKSGNYSFSVVLKLETQ